MTVRMMIEKSVTILSTKETSGILLGEFGNQEDFD